ncbi:cytochrome c [Ramlibacter sp. WS9]|uniref:c-type cytochrome n=1 Tax=Ramlibacter sp. WS9 TaxID=1882741 RepID=UPI0011415C84|nr:cytochrome c [Ramlibacter sp. WS9]ROZ69372.1 cytochrome c [Ramlibacter sp. WS9]
MTRIVLFIAFGLLAAALSLEYKRLSLKPWPPESFDDQEMHFKYGSIGAEVNGFPYLIWRELPSIFPEKIPRGYSGFGLISEPDRELPIGISVRRYGVLRVGFNCATCHTSVIDAGNKPHLVLGGPAEQLDLQGYIRFLIAAGSDPRLTAGAVIESAEKNQRPIGFFDKALLQFVVFGKLKEEIASLKTSLAWMERRPGHGPGRTDAGNFWRSRWGLNPELDDAVGTVDFPSVWNQRPRLVGTFHWDGNNSSLDERNISAALAGGTADWLLDRHSIGRVSAWLLDHKAPAFPLSVDAARAAVGKAVYERSGCATCHAPDGRDVGKVSPVQVLRTDSERNTLFSETMVANFDKVGKGYSWQFSHYRTTAGYVNMPLDGIWARGPYLHNGSIPTLRDLLAPASERPKSFRRGCTTFDPIDVGFKCETGFKFDTTLRGNSNAGHEYGTTLSAPEKDALLEFLKTQ